MNSDEKISIGGTEDFKRLLLSDAEYFEKYKPNSVNPNLNDLISCILIGYYDMYEKERTKNESVSEKIFGGKRVQLSYKPTVKTRYIIDSIKNKAYSGSGETEGRYLRNLLTAYLSKPLYERERIVFSDVYDELLGKCIDKETIRIVVGSKEKWNTVVALELVVGQGEMFNYLLCQTYYRKLEKYQVMSVRLCRIKHIGTSEKKFMLQPEINKYLKLTKDYGSQYAVNEETCMIVQFSDEGFRQFQRRYTGRPQYSDKNDFTLTFKCSEEQLFHYLKRFSGDEAYVISPASLKNRLIQFHKDAYDKYMQTQLDVDEGEDI